MASLTSWLCWRCWIGKLSKNHNWKFSSVSFGILQLCSYLPQILTTFSLFKGLSPFELKDTAVSFILTWSLQAGEENKWIYQILSHTVDIFRVWSHHHFALRKQTFIMCNVQCAMWNLKNMHMLGLTDIWRNW